VGLNRVWVAPHLSHSTLLQPVRAGGLELPNRIVMAPMTRARATAEHLPTALMAEYYAQRATAGLIVTEATLVAPVAAHWGTVPGIYNEEQAEGWRQVVDAVHAAGGRIALQLWHPGRSKTPDYTREEIDEIVGQFRDGARRARAAGFDGVELHGANGYVIEQFLRDGSNQRTDEYGGAIENRVKFLFEVLNAVLEEWPANHVGVKISTGPVSNKLTESDPAGMFGFVARRLSRYGLAYLQAFAAVGELREEYEGTLMLNGGFTRETGEAAVAAGQADLISFGTLFISNPDLPRRFQLAAPLNAADRSTYYGGAAAGYTDYAALA
jgi:N-ethylmaleimide reductase